MVIFFSADRILCNSTLCQHEGTCIDEVKGSYYCLCKTGYEGIHCDTRTDTGTYIHYIVGTNVCLYDLLQTIVVDELHFAYTQRKNKQASWNMWKYESRLNISNTAKVIWLG